MEIHVLPLEMILLYRFFFSPFVITEINFHTGLGGQPSLPVRLSGPSYQSSQL